MNTSLLRGSCLCGDVRYEIDGALLHIGHCHCSMCRKSHGAAFATWGHVDARQFRWSCGEALLRTCESSPGQQRLFCGRCGASLAAAQAGVVAEVALGTLDDDPLARPTEHIFVASKAPGHAISDGLPQHAGWSPGLGGHDDA